MEMKKEDEKESEFLNILFINNKSQLDVYLTGSFI